LMPLQITAVPLFTFPFLIVIKVTWLMMWFSISVSPLNGRTVVLFQISMLCLHLIDS
jgi:hypothetical protein